MLSRLGEGALEKLQTTKNIAKECLNRALGYADKDTEGKKKQITIRVYVGTLPN